MTANVSRDRDHEGRPRNARPRDALGRPLPRGAPGVPRIPDDYAPDATLALSHAARLLGEERPFLAHEVLEARWKSGPPPERNLWQGLAQICVGLTHLQRENFTGAAALLARGAARISDYPVRTPYGVDLDEMARVARLLAGTGSDPSCAIAAIRRVLVGS